MCITNPRLAVAHVNTAISRNRERVRCSAAKFSPSSVTASNASRSGPLPNAAVATHPRLAHNVTGSPNDAVVPRKRKSATIDSPSNTMPTPSNTITKPTAVPVIVKRPDVDPAHHNATNAATPAPVSNDRRRRVTACAS